MKPLRKGRYTARLAEGSRDLERTQALRYLCFRAGRGLPQSGGAALDQDPFDAACLHVMVEDERSGALVCCFRLMPLKDGSAIGQTYSSQYYDLRALAGFQAPMVEMGRFCIHPEHHDPDILRVAWGAMTRLVDETGAEMLFGCSSFHGAEAAAHHDALAMLKDRHLAPRKWLPRVKAPNVFRFARKLARVSPDMRRALVSMPPLLRTYLIMGGWVSDHAVVDRDLDTLHVFTGLEIAAIPPARVRLLRDVAG